MSPYSWGFVVKAVVLMASGIYFFARYRRQGPVFWISIILFTTGFFDLRFQMELWLAGRTVSDTTHWLLQSLIHLMFYGANTLYHCFVLIFFLEVSGYMKRYLYALVFLPLLYALLFRTTIYPELAFDYTFAAAWGILYWSVSFILFLVCTFKERNRFLYHLAFALMLLSNGLVLIVAHLQDKEFVELVNMTLFSLFLAFCLLLLIWVNMKKMLASLQREAVVRKMDMGTALLHHSFKNAVGKVKINAWNIRNSLAKEDGLSDQGKQEIEGHVQNLFSTYNHMMRMMARISHIVGNRMEVRPENVNLSELLEEAAEAAAAYPSVQVVTHAEPISVHADRAHVLESLINLIHNAIDAMQGEGTLTLSVGKSGRYVLVSVSDTGAGMPKEQMSQVFEPFFSTKGKTGKNMGLGLYYVRRVMEAHKGKVAINSKVGEGTTVTLQFRQRRGWHGTDQRAAGRG